jgi:hypothetical protein
MISLRLFSRNIPSKLFRAKVFGSQTVAASACSIFMADMPWPRSAMRTLVSRAP